LPLKWARCDRQRLWQQCLTGYRRSQQTCGGTGAALQGDSIDCICWSLPNVQLQVCNSSRQDSRRKLFRYGVCSKILCQQRHAAHDTADAEMEALMLSLRCCCCCCCRRFFDCCFVCSVRCCGSCALNLVGVACGRLDAFYEIGFGGCWDVAAGGFDQRLVSSYNSLCCRSAYVSHVLNLHACENVNHSNVTCLLLSPPLLRCDHAMWLQLAHVCQLCCVLRRVTASASAAAAAAASRRVHFERGWRASAGPVRCPLGRHEQAGASIFQEHIAGFHAYVIYVLTHCLAA
jgi:hypothetical protein